MPLAAPAAPGLPRVRLLRRPPGRATQALLGGGPVATVAVDALGADRGVPEVAAGVREAAAAGTRCILFGPGRAARGRAGASPRRQASRSSTRRRGSRTARSPARPCAPSPTRRSCRPRGRSPRGARDALVSAGSTGAALAAGLLHVKRMRGVYRPGARRAAAGPGPARRCCSTWARRVEVRAEQLVQFAFMGAAFMQRGAGRRAAARGAAVGRARSRRRARRAWSRRMRRSRRSRRRRSSSPATSRAAA